MGVISIINLRNIDLNLLVVFHLLMQERHVTRAAVKLHVTQGAVSAALNRMRVIFDDPLFVRTRGEMQPTNRAIELSGPVATALGRLADLLTVDELFDPRVSTRTFHLAMSDDVESIIAPGLIHASVEQGWKVKFAFHQTNSRLLYTALDEEEADLVIGPMPSELSGEYRAKQIISGRYLCIYSRKQFDFDGPISMVDYLRVGHIRVSFDAQRGFIDDLLEDDGHTRSVPVSLSHFAGILPVLHRAPVIATIPDYAAEAYASIADDLVVNAVPAVVPTYAVSIIWRVTSEGDSAHEWLRSAIASVSQRFLPK